MCVVFIITRRQQLNINNNNETLAEAASKAPCARCSMNFLATDNSSRLLFLELPPPGVGLWKWSAPQRSRGLRQLHQASPRGGSLGTGGSGRSLLVLFLFLNEATSHKSKYLLPVLDTHTRKLIKPSAERDADSQLFCLREVKKKKNIPTLFVHSPGKDNADNGGIDSIINSPTMPTERPFWYRIQNINCAMPLLFRSPC